MTDERQALVLDSWNYTIDARGRTFAAKCHFYQWTGNAFYRMDKVLKIPEFKVNCSSGVLLLLLSISDHNALFPEQDIQDISSLKFWPLTEEIKSTYQGKDVAR